MRPVGRTDAVTHGNGIKRAIPEESFLISDKCGQYQKRFLRNPIFDETQPWVTARGRPQGASHSLQPTAIQIKDSFGIVREIAKIKSEIMLKIPSKILSEILLVILLKTTSKILSKILSMIPSGINFDRRT